MTYPLSELCEIRSGYQFRKGVGDELPDAEPVSVIQARDLRDNQVAFETLESARIKAPEKYFVRPGDVLFLGRGHKFPALALPDVPRPTIAVHLFLILRISRPDLLRPEYLAWWLNHPQTQDGFKGVARRTYIPFVSTSDVRALELPLPPLRAQEHIVGLDAAAREEAILGAQLIEKRTHLVHQLTLQLATGQIEIS